jgi:predicted DNA-binding protein (MmcQ/YjbR family)
MPRSTSKVVSRRSFAGPLLERVRKLCLSLPEVTETAAWGHPNFRAGKLTFVTFEPLNGEQCIAFRLHPFEVDDLLKRAGYLRTPYGQGKWISVSMQSRPAWAVIEGLILASYQTVALKRMLKSLEPRVARRTGGRARNSAD